jgi:hypothetical protein
MPAKIPTESSSCKAMGTSVFCDAQNIQGVGKIRGTGNTSGAEWLRALIYNPEMLGWKFSNYSVPE